MLRSRECSNISYFMPPDPMRNQGYLDTLRHTRPENDPEAPPPKKPGDAMIAGATIIGVLIGGVVGFLLSFQTAAIFIVVLATIGGILIGGVSAAFIGEWIRNRKYKD